MASFSTCAAPGLNVVNHFRSGEEVKTPKGGQERPGGIPTGVDLCLERSLDAEDQSKQKYVPTDGERLA